MKKKDKVQGCKNILYKYPPKGNVTDNDDLRFLLSIFESHPEWHEKKGDGIEKITVQPAIYGTKCFYIHRVDGSCTDISFRAAIKSPTKLSDVKKACRQAVRSSIVAFKKECYEAKMPCQVTGQPLDWDNMHIDHYNFHFNKLFNLWVADKDLEHLYMNVNTNKDNSQITEFENEEIKKAFKNWHDRNTNLRPVSKHANLSILNRK
jgi:hypothetical protein